MTLWIFSANTSPERAAEDGEVLAEDAHPPAVDGAEAGDHAVGVGPVVLEPHAVGPVAGQHVELLEGPLVEQVLDALPGGHLALGVVPLDGPSGYPACRASFLRSARSARRSAMECSMRSRLTLPGRSPKLGPPPRSGLPGSTRETGYRSGLEAGARQHARRRSTPSDARSLRRL